MQVQVQRSSADMASENVNVVNMESQDGLKLLGEPSIYDSSSLRTASQVGRDSTSLPRISSIPRCSSSYGPWLPAPQIRTKAKLKKRRDSHAKKGSITRMSSVTGIAGSYKPLGDTSGDECLNSSSRGWTTLISFDFKSRSIKRPPRTATLSGSHSSLRPLLLSSSSSIVSKSRRRWTFGCMRLNRFRRRKYIADFKGLVLSVRQFVTL